MNDWGKPQNRYFLNGSAIKEGGGVKAVPLKKKKSDGDVSTAIKLGGRGYGLKKKYSFPKSRDTETSHQ